jgi:threonine aldolase
MPIDLRSDTMTLPTDAMRAAMASADLGDDVFGEDPTVNRLEAMAAERMGKEVALFVPSGSMGNLIAFCVLARPGEEIVLEERSHPLWSEFGAVTRIAGLLPRPIAAPRGVLTPALLAPHLQPEPGLVRARTAIISLENTHNAAGGTIYHLETLAEIRRLAARHRIAIHLDGARLFNAAVALGVRPDAIAQHADTVTFCFSKGLSAPVGSVLTGPRALIDEGRRVRKLLGGGMRQAGVLAAAAVVALETMVERLAEDHGRARRLAEGLAEIPGIEVDLPSVQTNIVMFRVPGLACDAPTFAARLRDAGVLVIQLSADTIRMVTHRHIEDPDVAEALKIIERVASECRPECGNHR